MRSYKKLAIIILIVALATFTTGYILARNTSSGGQSNTRVADKEYSLLAKRLFMDNPNDTRINFSPLRRDLNQYFADKRFEGSVYFEYLPTGTSVRVNPDVKYRAASLIKLPVAMEFYKAVEQGKLTLDQTITLKEEWLNDRFGSLYEKGPGYQLTLEEAAEIMIKESDNTALRIIIDATANLGIEDRALGALDIELKTYKDGSIDIGTRSYSSFLKCLYFACYNTKQHSQAILELLATTPFNDRLVAGIDDKTIKTAHKIGVFNTEVQSDCGIVYVPDNNYVLCVMLEGDNNEQTNRSIAEISRLVYQFVTQ